MTKPSQTHPAAPDAQPRALFLLLIILAMAFWGGAWTSGKLISSSVSAQTTVFYRFLLAALAMTGINGILRRSLRAAPRELLRPAAAAIFFTAYNQLFFTGLEAGLAGAGGVLVTTLNPIITHILAILILGLPLSRRSAGGLLLGLTGGALMLRLWTLNPADILQLGNGYFLAAAAVWAAVTLINGRARSQAPFTVYTLYFYLFSALYALPFSLAAGDTARVFSQGAPYWFNLFYLSLLAMAFASTIYFLAARRLGGDRASSFVFLVPLFAVLFSLLILGEIPRLNTLIGGALAMTAVYLINRPGRHRAGGKKPDRESG